MSERFLSLLWDFVWVVLYFTVMLTVLWHGAKLTIGDFISFEIYPAKRFLFKKRVGE